MIKKKTAAFGLCLLLAFPLPSAALTLSKNPGHYAAEMENYFEHPRPEMLVPMLRSFARSGVLKNSGKRLFTASFLAALALQKSLNVNALINEAGGDDGDVRAVLAWACHLSGAPAERINSLLGPGQKVLAGHILSTPGNLADWNPAWEKSTVDMYWAAFNATGGMMWIDGIINAALEYARLGKGDPGRHAAALLYEYVPVQEKIKKRIEERMAGAALRERQLMETILRQGK